MTTEDQQKESDPKQKSNVPKRKEKISWQMTEDQQHSTVESVTIDYLVIKFRSWATNFPQPHKLLAFYVSQPFPAEIFCT